MQATICGNPSPLTRSKLLEMMTAAWRLEVAKALKRLDGVPGAAAAAQREELEDELQLTDELANQARVPRVCEVCGADISKDAGRCTNNRCAKCHSSHCTPGGSTSPGHGRGKVLAPFAAAAALVLAGCASAPPIMGPNGCMQVSGRVITIYENCTLLRIEEYPRGET